MLRRRDPRCVFRRSDQVLLLLRTSFVSLSFRTNHLKILTSELSFLLVNLVRRTAQIASKIRPEVKQVVMGCCQCQWANPVKICF